MDNNKGLKKTRPKSNPELRKIYFQNGAEIGIENGHKIGTYEPAPHSFEAKSER